MPRGIFRSGYIFLRAPPSPPSCTSSFLCLLHHFFFFLLLYSGVSSLLILLSAHIQTDTEPLARAVITHQHTHRHTTSTHTHTPLAIYLYIYTTLCLLLDPVLSVIPLFLLSCYFNRHMAALPACISACVSLIAAELLFFFIMFCPCIQFSEYLSPSHLGRL